MKSLVHFVETDCESSWTRGPSFGCVPQAFRKAPLCFTIGDICFGKVAFNISLRVQYDDKQMGCSDLCLGCWCGDLIAIMENDGRSR